MRKITYKHQDPNYFDELQGSSRINYNQICSKHSKIQMFEHTQCKLRDIECFLKDWKSVLLLLTGRVNIFPIKLSMWDFTWCMCIHTSVYVHLYTYTYYIHTHKHVIVFQSHAKMYLLEHIARAGKSILKRSRDTDLTSLIKVLV